MTDNPKNGEVKTKAEGSKVKTGKVKDPRLQKGGRKRQADKWRIDELDRVIIKHLVEYPNTTQKELAKVANLSMSGIRHRINRPAFKKAMEDLHAKTEEIFLKAQTLAARRLMKLIQSDDDTIALRACNMALQPMINKATIDVNQSIEKVYRVRFGEQGQMFQEVLEAETVEKKTTLDLLTENDAAKNGTDA